MMSNPKNEPASAYCRDRGMEQQKFNIPNQGMNPWYSGPPPRFKFQDSNMSRSPSFCQAPGPPPVGPPPVGPPPFYPPPVGPPPVGRPPICPPPIGPPPVGPPPVGPPPVGPPPVGPPPVGPPPVGPPPVGPPPVGPPPVGPPPVGPPPVGPPPVGPPPVGPPPVGPPPVGPPPVGPPLAFTNYPPPTVNKSFNMRPPIGNHHRQCSNPPGASGPQLSQRQSSYRDGPPASAQIVKTRPHLPSNFQAPPSFHPHQPFTPTNVHPLQHNQESDYGRSKKLFAYSPTPTPTLQPKPIREPKSVQKLELWLQKNEKTKKSLKNNLLTSAEKPKLWECTSHLSETNHLLSTMSAHVEQMDKMTTSADSMSWESFSDQCEKMKEKILKLQPLMTEEYLSAINKKLTRTRLKRARLKRARHAKYEETLREKEAWEKKSKKIDQCREKLRKKLMDENTKKARKAAADLTLAKVTKEIQDANRLIETMTALQKLRLVRRDAAQKRGESALGESRQSFEQKIADMTRLVKSQLEGYREEETKLRQIIQSEQDKKTMKEKEIQDEKKRKREQEEDTELKDMLFGSQGMQESEQLYPFVQYYKQGEDNLSALVQIRHEWDAFVVPEKTPGCSSVPTFWVVPEDPSSSVWASCLK